MGGWCLCEVVGRRWSCVRRVFIWEGRFLANQGGGSVVLGPVLEGFVDAGVFGSGGR